jgi:hypothetical protein
VPPVFRGCRRRSTDARVEDELVEVTREDGRWRNVRGDSGGLVGEINLFLTGGGNQFWRNDARPTFVSKGCATACVAALGPERDLAGSAGGRGRRRRGSRGRRDRRGVHRDVISKGTVVVDRSR